MTTATNSAVNVIVQNLDNINLPKDLFLPFIGTLLGVIFGAILSYLFNQKNEKKLLKFKIELNIVEELLSLLKTPQIYFLGFDIRTMLNHHNELINSGEYRDSYGGINYIYKLDHELIFSGFEKLSSHWSENNQNMLSIIRYMETRKIPLRRLTPYIEEYLNFIRKMCNLWESFYIQKYQMIIQPCIRNHELIDDSTIESISSEWPLIEETYHDIVAYYNDLETALQNVFLIELYSKKNKIDYRKPLDPKYTVIKPLKK